VQASGGGGRGIHVGSANDCGRGRRVERGEVSEIVSVRPASRCVSTMSFPRLPFPPFPVLVCPPHIYEVSMKWQTVGQGGRCSRVLQLLGNVRLYSADMPEGGQSRARASGR
jgi:hypothetical protein